MEISTCSFILLLAGGYCLINHLSEIGEAQTSASREIMNSAGSRPFLEKEFGQIRSILTRNLCN